MPLVGLQTRPIRDRLLRRVDDGLPQHVEAFLKHDRADIERREEEYEDSEDNVSDEEDDDEEGGEEAAAPRMYMKIISSDHILT